MSLYNELNRWEQVRDELDLHLLQFRRTGAESSPPNYFFTPLILTCLWANVDPNRVEGAKVDIWTVLVATVSAAILPREQVAAYALPLPVFPLGAEEDVCVNSKCTAPNSGSGQLILQRSCRWDWRSVLFPIFTNPVTKPLNMLYLKPLLSSSLYSLMQFNAHTTPPNYYFFFNTVLL